MTETLAARIQQRLDALGLSEREASLLATGSDATIRMIRIGKSRNPRSDTMAKLAEVLRTTPQWLLTGVEAEPAPPASPLPIPLVDAEPNTRPAPGLSLPRSFDLPRDLPALGTAAASEIGQGAFQLTSDVVDYLRRPPALIGISDAYALYVEGDSMWPRFEHGDPIFVHPHRKARPGDYIVIQEPDGRDDEHRAYVKRLVKVSGNILRVRQYNPDSTLDFTIRPGLIWHKVLTDADLWSF